MGRPVRAAILDNHFQKHIAKARHRPNGQAIGFARQRRQRMIGPKNKGRAINEMKVAPFAKSAHIHTALVSGVLLPLF